MLPYDEYFQIHDTCRCSCRCPTGYCCHELRNKFFYMTHVFGNRSTGCCCQCHELRIKYMIHDVVNCPTGCCCLQLRNKYFYMIDFFGNCPTGCCCLELVDKIKLTCCRYLPYRLLLSLVSRYKLVNT